LRSLQQRNIVSNACSPPVVVVKKITSHEERDPIPSDPHPQTQTSASLLRDHLPIIIHHSEDGSGGIMKKRTLKDSISSNDDLTSISSASPTGTKFSNELQRKRKIIAKRLSRHGSNTTLETDSVSDRGIVSISFGLVSIREFRVIPGDNP